MSSIVQRKDRYYLVAYDGLDPLSGKERRLWHPSASDDSPTSSSHSPSPPQPDQHTLVNQTNSSPVQDDEQLDFQRTCHARSWRTRIGSERELRVGVEVVDIGG